MLLARAQRRSIQSVQLLPLRNPGCPGKVNREDGVPAAAAGSGFAWSRRTAEKRKRSVVRQEAEAGVEGTAGDRDVACPYRSDRGARRRPQRLRRILLSDRRMGLGRRDTVGINERLRSVR